MTASASSGRPVASRRLLHSVSWLVGLAVLAALVLVFRPSGIDDALVAIGARGVLLWLLFTMLARLLVVETSVQPLRRLGYTLSRADAFWIGWVRTFGNQIVPFSGLAFYLREIVRRTSVPLAELTSLATPQVLMALVAASMIGIASVVFGFELLDGMALPLGAFYCLVLAVSLAVACRADGLMRRLPGRLARLSAVAAESFRRLSASWSFLASLALLNCGAIVLRGLRVWLLFTLIGADLGWQQALLIIAIAESATLLQLTPGGLGLREGALVGAAALVDVAQASSVIVALVDRLFMVALTSALFLPALAWLRRTERG